MSKLALAAAALVAIVAALVAWFVRATDGVAPLQATATSIDLEHFADELFDAGSIAVAVVEKEDDRKIAPSTGASSSSRAPIEVIRPTGALDVLFVDADDQPIVVSAASVRLTWLSPGFGGASRDDVQLSVERAAEQIDRLCFDSLAVGEWVVSATVEDSMSSVPWRETVRTSARTVARRSVDRMRRITVHVIDEWGSPAALDDPLDGPPLGVPFSIRVTRTPARMGAPPIEDSTPLRQRFALVPGARPTGFLVSAAAVRTSWVSLVHGDRTVALALAPEANGEITLRVAAAELEPRFCSLAMCVLDAATMTPVPGVRATWTPIGLKQRPLELDGRGCGVHARLPPVPGTLEIVAAGFLTSQRRLSLESGESRDLGVIKLSPAGLIRGRIVDLTKRSAEVYAWRLVDGEPTWPKAATAKDDGSFVFEAIPYGDYLLSTKTDRCPSIEDVRRGSRPDSAFVVVAGSEGTEVALRISVDHAQSGGAR